MDNNFNQTVEQGLTNRKKFFLYTGIALIGVFLLATLVYFLFLGNINVSKHFTSEKKELLPERATQTMVFVKNFVETKAADDLYKKGDYKGAYSEFENVLNTKNFTGDSGLRQSLELYKIAARLQFERDEALQDYYKFYKSRDNSDINRAYAMLMAQQNVVAYNDAQKLLFILDNREVGVIKVLDNKNINYAISKKIYQLYPFPITVARLAAFEIDGLDKKDKDLKKKADEIYKNYLFNFDSVLQIMLKEEGFRHLVANSLSAKASLDSRMEDLGLKDAKETTQIYSEAIKYAKLYSPRSTYDFLLSAFLNHEVKIKNEGNVDKILDLFREDKKSGYITPNVKKNFTDEKRMQENHPFIFERYKNNEIFRSKIIEIME